MRMRLEDYIQNPMGENNAVFSQREMYRNLYTDKFNKLLLREAGKIDFLLYKDTDRYFIHIKIPSEVVEKFYYDTVIEFYAVDSGVTVGASLKDYFVRFYSNDPSFVFTFAHAFIKNDLFIKELTPKMSTEAVENSAKVKNPKNLIGYVKSIYFAYLLIKNRGLMQKVMFDTYGKKFDIKQLLQFIEPASSKVQKRQELGAEVEKRKRIKSRTERPKDEHSSKQSKNSMSAKVVNTVKKTTGIKNTKFSKKK